MGAGEIIGSDHVDRRHRSAVLLRDRARWAASVAVVVALTMLAATGVADAAITHLPEGSIGSFSQPAAIAVEEETGDLLVLQPGVNTVTKIDQSGDPVEFSEIGSSVLDGKGGGNCPAVSTSCDETPQDGFSFDSPDGAQVAVDNSSNPATKGDIYVADSLDHVVDVFAPGGRYLGQLTAAGSGGPAFQESCGVAVGPTGNVLVGDYPGGNIHEYVPSGDPVNDADFTRDIPVQTTCEVAAGIGPTAGSVLANRWRWQVEKFNPDGSLAYVVDEEAAEGVAVNPTNGNAVMVNQQKVSEWEFSGSGPAPVWSSGGRIVEAGGVAVDGQSGRIFVSDVKGGTVDVFGAAVPVVRPTVAINAYAPLTPTAVKVRGTVDPHGGDTTYYFEYGRQPCSAGGCASAPRTRDAPAGNGSGNLNVVQTLSGLKGGGQYWFRLVATNSAGTSISEEGTFVTQVGSTSAPCPNAALRSGLADRLAGCRGYELVSAFDPSVRNGVDVLEDSRASQAATDGNAFKFASVGASSSGSEGAPLLTEYVAVRNGDGSWSVHPITPPQEGLSAWDLLDSAVPHFVSISPDLDTGVFASKGLIGAEGANVAKVRNLYLGENLLSTTGRRFRLLTDARLPQHSNFEGGPTFSAASADYSHVLFESPFAMNEEAEALESGEKLYQWVEGRLELVGSSTFSEGFGNRLRAGAGSGEGGGTLQSMSKDGSRIVFSRDNDELFLAQGPAAGGTVVKVDASEKTNGSGPGGTDPNTAGATFWGATPDLSKIFFGSTEGLTDGAPEDEPGVEKLYRYEADAPAGQRLTLLSVDDEPADGIADQATGVVTFSADGSYIYFLSEGQLVAGRPIEPGARIFVWHEGTVREVALVGDEEEQERLVQKRGQHWARVTPDGTKMAFVDEGAALKTSGEECPGASTECQGVFLYDATSGALTCVTCSLGARANFTAQGTDIFVPPESFENRPLTSDDSAVYFNTTQPLSPYDENNRQDVYELDTRSGEVNLISSGLPDEEAQFLDATLDGTNVFFWTRAQLVGTDRDDNGDVYDARVGGGTLPPVPAAESCADPRTCRPGTGGGAAAEEAAPASEWIGAVKKATKHRHHRHHKKRRRHHQRAARDARHRQDVQGHGGKDR